MRSLVQRVKRASVKVNNSLIGEIDVGLLVFIGVENSDSLNDFLFKNFRG